MEHYTSYLSTIDKFLDFFICHKCQMSKLTKIIRNYSMGLCACGRDRLIEVAIQQRYSVYSILLSTYLQDFNNWPLDKGWLLTGLTVFSKYLFKSSQFYSGLNYFILIGASSDIRRAFYLNWGPNYLYPIGCLMSKTCTRLAVSMSIV